MSTYKDSRLSLSFSVSELVVDSDKFDSLPFSFDSPPVLFSEIFPDFQVDLASEDSPTLFSKALFYIHSKLTQESFDSFPFSDEFLFALFDPFNPSHNLRLPSFARSLMLKIISFSIQSFPVDSVAFIRSDFLPFLSSLFSNDSFFTSHIRTISHIVTSLNDSSPLFLRTITNSEPTLISRIVELVLRYKDLQYPIVLPATEKSEEIEWKEYLEFGLPMLASVLPAAELAPDTQIDFFNALSHIGSEKFVFDSTQPAPNGLSIPIIASLIRCFTALGHLIDPALFIGLIRNSRYYETFFNWLLYIESINDTNQQRRAFLNEIVCNLCPLWLLCIQIDPPIFLDFQYEGLFNFLWMPFSAYDQNEMFRSGNTFIVTQKHFEDVLDLIVTILQKIGSEAITENPPNHFQNLITEKLKEHLGSTNGIRSRILTAFAAITVHTEESMKQRIIFEFGCLRGMIDLVEQSPPEVTELLVRALVILFDQAMMFDENLQMQGLLESLNWDEIETNLPESALPELEQLRGMIGRIHGGEVEGGFQ